MVACRTLYGIPVYSPVWFVQIVSRPPDSSRQRNYMRCHKIACLPLSSAWRGKHGMLKCCLGHKPGCTTIVISIGLSVSHDSTTDCGRRYRSVADPCGSLSQLTRSLYTRSLRVLRVDTSSIKQPFSDEHLQRSCTILTCRAQAIAVRCQDSTGAALYDSPRLTRTSKFHLSIIVDSYQVYIELRCEMTGPCRHMPRSRCLFRASLVSSLQSELDVFGMFMMP